MSGLLIVRSDEQVGITLCQNSIPLWARIPALNGLIRSDERAGHRVLYANVTNRETIHLAQSLLDFLVSQNLSQFDGWSFIGQRHTVP